MSTQPNQEEAKHTIEPSIPVLRTSEPRGGLKENEQYEEALCDGLENPDVHTIALAGVYGSGKSSILKSVKRRHAGKRKARTVSLLGFRGTTSDTCDVDLQAAIIKQLHDSARKSWVRGSKYGRVERNRSAGVAFFLACWILFGFLLCDQFYNFILSYIESIPEVGNLAVSDRYLIGAPFAILACFMLALVASLVAYYLLPHIKIAEISIFGCSLKTATAEPNFNNSTDEIINILERGKIRVLIFEDLDRFNQPQIYEQLYNLCTTVNEYMYNNHPWRYKKRRATFVFALRDDLLPVAKERTKLFDLYIPVNSHTSPHNSYDRVMEIFDEYITTYGPKKSDKRAWKQFEAALVIVSKSTTDVRVMNAIFNSALTLKRSFVEQGVEWPEDDKIIIAVAMRQLFPREYALEVAGKGFLDAAYEECIKKRTTIFKTIQENSYRAEDLIAKLEYAIKDDTQKKHHGYDVDCLRCITISGKTIDCGDDRVEYWRQVVNSGAEKIIFEFDADFASEYTVSQLNDLGPYDALVNSILHSPELARVKDKTEKTGKDVLKLYYNEACEEALREHAESQNINDKERSSNEELAKWLGECIKRTVLDSSYVCYVSPIVKKGESATLTAFRLRNLARGMTDYAAPLTNDEDIGKLISSLNPAEKSSVALLNVHIIYYLLLKSNSSNGYTELVSEIFGWQADHVEKLSGFYDMFYAWCAVQIGNAENLEDPHYLKVQGIMLRATCLLAQRCREQVLTTIINNWSLVPEALSINLATTALTAQDGPLHLISGTSQCNEILKLLEQITDDIIQRGGIEQLVQTIALHGNPIRNGSAFAKYPDHLRFLVDHNLLIPTASNLRHMPTDQHIEYLDNNLGDNLDEGEALALLNMIQGEGLNLTDELVDRFAGMLPKESGIELVASSNLEGETLRETVRNLGDPFKQLCDIGGTVQFDHRTDSLMKLLRKLKEAGIITRYWFDKRGSKLKASAPKRDDIQEVNIQ